jgi:alkanesulfonate monooxygenase SsuD/methylene tetrahydromethanopterin reductase-like flavin-dependent oxidoreductase (luciferase family)
VSGKLFPFAVFLHCAESDDEAAETVYPYLRRFRNAVEQHYEWRREGGHLPERFTQLPWNDETSIDLPLANHIIGSPETCLERLEAFNDLGLNYALCMVNWGLMPFDKVTASMRLFAEKVIPEARSWAIDAQASTAA